MAIKKCKECGSDVSTTADACPKCGAKVKKTSILTMGCATVILGFVGLGVLGALLGDGSPSQAPSPSSAAPAAAPTEPAKAEEPAPPEAIRWLTDSCRDTAKNFGAQSKMTDLQKKAIWEQNQLSGAHFKWTLEVTSVDTTFGKIQAQFKCKGSRAFVSDVILGVDDEQTALSLVKGNRYMIHGTLRDWGNFMGLSGDLVEVLDE